MIPRFYTPYRQVVIAALISLCINASWNAVLGVGGGGLMDSSISARANVAGAIASCVAGLVVSGVNNYLGVRLAMFIASVTYTLFMASFVLFAYWPQPAPVVITGALKGFGLLMSGMIQSVMLVSYPQEAQRGSYLSTFFLVASLNGVVGGAVALGLNYSNSSRGLGLATYYVATAVTIVAVLLSLLLVSPRYLTKDDGSPIVVPKFQGWRREIRLLFRAARDGPLVLFIPYFAITRFYYAYQFNGFNFTLFTIRTRAINCIVYYLSSLTSSYVLGWLLDRPHWSRRFRGLTLLAAILVMVLASYVGALAIQVHGQRTGRLVDFTQVAYLGPLAVFMQWGALDAVINAFSLWALTLVFPHVESLDHHLGFLFLVQSIGTAVSWQLDAAQVSLLAQNLVVIGMTVFGSLVMAGLVIQYTRPAEAIQPFGNDDSGSDFSGDFGINKPYTPNQVDSAVNS
ncbi:hypothetical protein H4R33_003490 [Dimargaris cristalligena]|uniref:Major facilitator superfamily domain-containing protein n=1 Tax=Dimargaris cristalligena TaxID=215637 RepID=A0A4P9ZYM8_9FUNG|nr:hypothetical protein H4R33_003490 [Dimargaris cristalligena]RKP38844.1 hypothetical protein BJ085DRAFT_34088 [Dimargaris cristalligena]|eukprot:RKP38844.1 hypothetical protein BJ085DRAFT_34088 [Dimargaris cristalligena]